MPYLVDGHNLIPYIPGIELADLDDESSLVDILRRFAAQRRSKVEVYFDQAPPTQAGSRISGLVKAIYVPDNSNADSAIKRRLAELGRSAKNWTVVSTDREVQAEARSYHCPVLKSAEFAAIILEKKGTSPAPAEAKDQPEVSPEDMDFWLDQFGGK